LLGNGVNLDGLGDQSSVLYIGMLKEYFVIIEIEMFVKQRNSVSLFKAMPSQHFSQQA
jgi:hypothetical protein